jgi:hypothetical protein
MTSSQPDQPTLISIAPRFPVGDMEQALAFYAQLGFVTTYRDGEFAFQVDVSRQGVHNLNCGRISALICSGAFERTLDLNNDPFDQTSQYTAEQGDYQME